MTTLEIFRPPTTSIVVINIDEKTTFSKRLMAEHFIKCEFIYPSVIALQIGDFITYGTENYYINRIPSVVKLNDSTFQYSIQFESVLYNLSRKLFISSDGLSDFSYNGSATDFLTNIIASINEIDGTPVWAVGAVDASDDLTLQFNNESCRAALTRVAEAFKMEFELIGKAISLKNSVGTTTGYSFQYGRDLGLYKLERQQVQDQNILTKVFGFGGTRNIPSDYRGRAKRLVFETGGLRYLTKNTALYGTIEGQFTDDEIYPKRTSTLTDVNMVFDAGVGGTDFNNRTSYIEDSTIDFDINDYKIDGLGLGKIVFKSGDLSGVECEIWKFDYANKRIYINPSTGPDGYTLPFYNGGSPVIPVIGDSYTLVDMEMPAAYVTAAETALQVATQTFIDENSVPMVVYTCDIDPKYAAGISLSLNAGDKVTVIDTDLGINSLIRVSAIEFPLVNPYQIKATIADFVPYTLQERIVKAAITNKQNIITVDKNAEELARINSLRLHRELAKNTIPMYQGLYAAGTTYYGNPSRIDIVKYNPGAGEVYYIAKPNAPSESFSGIVPTNTDYWERFEAQYTSLATSLFFAELAYIDNLGVKYFNGVPVPVGDLAGNVVHTQENVPKVSRVDRVTHGTDTSDSLVGCNRYSEVMVWNTNKAVTVTNFCNAYSANFGAVSLNDNGDGSFDFEANVPGDDFEAAISGIGNTATNIIPNGNGIAQIDTLTLTGAAGTAKVLCDGVTRSTTFFNALADTAAGFVIQWAADYLPGKVAVTQGTGIHTDDIILTSTEPGTAFSGATTITNIANIYRGGIRIEGNEIWENEENNDAYGFLTINRKGYQGGITKSRTLFIGDGKGNILLQVGATSFIGLKSEYISVPNIPTADPGGGAANFLWIDANGFLKVGS